MVKKMAENKNIPQGLEIIAKNDILTFQEKQISCIGHQTKKTIETIPGIRELEKGSSSTCLIFLCTI